MSDKQIQQFKLDDVNDIGTTTFTRVDIPKGGKVLDVTYSNGRLFLHVIVKPGHKKSERWFAIYQENVPMEDYEKKTFEYIGMVNTVPSLYVFELHE